MEQVVSICGNPFLGVAGGKVVGVAVRVPGKPLVPAWGVPTGSTLPRLHCGRGSSMAFQALQFLCTQICTEEETGWGSRGFRQIQRGSRHNWACYLGTGQRSPQ